MTDLFNDYRKGNSREDPRLQRRDNNSDRNKSSMPISPKKTDPSKEQRSRGQTWQNQYSNAMPGAYQHLPPNNMYGEYQNQGYQSTYSAYPQNYGSATQQTYQSYPGYNQAQGSYSSGGVPTGEEYQAGWSYPNVAQPPPSVNQPVDKTDDHKKEAVAQELKQQKASMLKQREEYIRKVTVLHRELDLLRNQKQELVTDKSSEHDIKHILKENNKLQVEIQSKMKTIYNVIDLLTNIIGDGFSVSDLEIIFKEDASKNQREKGTKSTSGTDGAEAKYCYIYYDPELHWCRICDVFPQSAKDYLLHLHSEEHRKITQERDMVDTPWHRLPGETELPSYENAPKKRMPIKGLQFLISATAWYCKLCDTWVGDLHCASQHLKSQNHHQNYSNFVDQNPHWEIEWLRDRDKAVARVSKTKRTESDDEASTRSSEKKKKHASKDKDKRKKKRSKRRRKHSSDSSSSSSSSDSSSEDEVNDKSKSIRVEMRNKMKMQAQMIMNEDVGGKWEVLGRLVEEQKKKDAEVKKEEPEDRLISQWMTVSEPPDKDKVLLDGLKDRMKQKQDAEKKRLADLEEKRREKEKQEQVLREQKEREEKAKEEERKRQGEELERIREKEREAIRFKTKEKPKRSSPTPQRGRRSRSSSVERRTEDRRSSKDYNENGKRASESRRSPSYDRSDRRNSPINKRKHRSDENDRNRGSNGSGKKPHFIGRMPLFKNKKPEEREQKEIKKEDYDIPRRSRFQPGNLARAFIPEPDVVCFPKLSSIPPIMVPSTSSYVPTQPPDPPKISEEPEMKPPPPPIIKKRGGLGLKVNGTQGVELRDQNLPPPPPPPQELEEFDEQKYEEYDESMNMWDPSQMDPTAMMRYQYGMDYYPPVYDYGNQEEAAVPPPEEHTMPLPPPPLPPDDPTEDLALLGISADDLAAQHF